MRKHFLFLLLFLAIDTIALWASDTSVGGIWYVFNDNTQTAAVTFQGLYSSTYSNEYTGSVVIPSSVTYKSVVYSVTKIGGAAFENCSGLTSVTIPNSVTYIGESAFEGCTSLTSIVIPEGVTSVGKRTFKGCTNLTSVTIPNSITSINEYAFFNCSSLTSVIIPHSVISIKEYAFSECSSLTSVTWNAKSCANSGGFGSQVESFTFGNEVIVIPEQLCFNMYNLKSITIPNSVVSIGKQAFQGCTGLTSVSIGNGVTSIGNKAFFMCNKLTSVTIPENVTAIGDGAFDGCSNIISVTLNSSAIVGKDYSSDSNITSIFGSQVIESIIGEGVTSIGECAFSGCSGLTSVTIPNSVTSIGGHTFQNCSSLTSIAIPSNVASIGEYAFYGCSGLTNITIPNSVTSIGEWAFSSCSSLTSVTLNSNSIVGKNYSYNSNLIDMFGSQVTEYIIGDEVTSIGDYAFYASFGCSGKSVNIGNSVTSIGYLAFSGCSGLTSVTIPNSVTSIGNYAFRYCTGLTSVTIPNSVTSIGEYAFYGCSSLTSVTLNSNSIVGKNYSDNYNLIDLFGSQVTEYVIGNDVTSVGDYAFFGGTNLTSVTLGNSIANIKQYAFKGCSSLTSITIPNSVKSIGSYAFDGCSGLKSVHIGDLDAWCGISYSGSSSNPLCYAKHLYLNGTEVTDLTIPNSVTSIKDYAFYNCTSLTSVAIPNSVTSIKDYAFCNCSGLKSVTMQGETPPTISTNVFSYCNNLSKIFVPCGTLDIYKQLWSDYSYIIKYPPTEYSVECKMNYNGVGNISVDNNICASIISATSYYGYHFAQWSDGNTDNPRTIELTQDTTFTAEFAKNSYSITTASSNEEWGTTAGDATVLYQDQVEISATANYGYHFVQWNDGNSWNPRTITVTGDATYTATFAKNTYKVNKVTDNSQGSISGSSQAYYLDQVTLTAVPKYGYHFTQWSDGVTDNPRTIELTRDTTFTAEFAIDKSGTCGENLQLTWEYDSDSKTLSISGNGNLTDNKRYGVEAVNEMTSLIINNGVNIIGESAFADVKTLLSVSFGNTITAIDDKAFNGCDKLKSITLPNSVTSIGIDAFANCTMVQRVSLGEGITTISNSAFANCPYLIEVKAKMALPPVIEASVFSGCGDLSGITCYVPIGSLAYYQKLDVWKEFNLVESDFKEEDAVETTSNDAAVSIHKELRNGQVFILRDGKTYTVQGQQLK